MTFDGSSRTVQARISGGGPRGVLEMNIDGQGWGVVCDDYFDHNNNGATAFCMSLGFAGGGVQYDESGRTDYAADDIVCETGSTSIEQCTSVQQPYVHNCGSSETVGIECNA